MRDTDKHGYYYYYFSELYIKPTIIFFFPHSRILHDDNTNSQNFRLMSLIKTEIHLPRTMHEKEGSSARSPLSPRFITFRLIVYRKSLDIGDREIMEEKTPMRVYLKWPEIKTQDREDRPLNSRICFLVMEAERM